MATRMTVKCKNCNNEFYLFWHTFDINTEICCPYCDCVFPKEHNEYIKSALGTAWELNYKTRSMHEEGSCDLFEFSIDEIHVPIEKFKFSTTE